MQALQWSICIPTRCVTLAIAAAPKLSAENIGFNEVARQAIRTDPGFHDGHFYAHGVVLAARAACRAHLGHLTYLSDDLMGEVWPSARGETTSSASMPDSKWRKLPALSGGDKFAGYTTPTPIC